MCPVRLNNAALERKGREGRREILSYFASFATSAFDRDVPERQYRAYRRSASSVLTIDSLAIRVTIGAATGRTITGTCRLSVSDSRSTTTPSVIWL